MYQSLAGQVAVVTGGAGGLGSAAALRLSQEGCRVVVVDRDAGGAQAVAASLPGESSWLRADVTADDAADEYVRHAAERFGRVDLHLLNAGIPGTVTALPDITVAEFDEVMAVNVRGVFLGLRAAFRQYERQRSGGSIVITASIASLRGSADLIAYQTSKHAVLGLLRGAAMYGAPIGIRVNAVAPGIVPTSLFPAGGAAPGGRDDMRQRAATSPLRRAGDSAEIAAVTAFLLSAESSYMVGDVVSVDGGAAIVSSVRPSGGAGAWDAAGYDAARYRPGEGEDA
jgi:NAD(P)-dependent dehydrogenase (short-subunit alcohol dehydrogenase family)